MNCNQKLTKHERLIWKENTSQTLKYKILVSFLVQTVIVADTEDGIASRPSNFGDGGTGICGVDAAKPCAMAEGVAADEKVAAGDQLDADSRGLVLPWHLRECLSRSARRENDDWQNLQRYSSRPARPWVFMWRVSLLDWAQA